MINPFPQFVLSMLAVASVYCLIAPIPTRAQVPGSVVIVKDVDPQTQWYRYQQWLTEGQNTLNDYNTLQYMIKNFQQGNITGLAPLANAALAMRTDILNAMYNNHDPQLAAALRANQYLQNELGAINQVEGIINTPGTGNVQMLQATNLLLSTIVSQNAQQSTMNYAAAQDALRRAQNAQALQQANDASTIQP